MHARVASSRNGAVRVALVTATAGYYHQSIPTAQRVMQEIAQRDGQLDIGAVISDVESLDRLTPALLADHDLLCFLSTTGDLPLDDGQKAAILQFVHEGHGFVGIHSATATLKSWPEYGDLLGAVFKMHPPPLSFGVVVVDQTHPSTRHLPPTIGVIDELYTFVSNPDPDGVRILLRAEPGSAGQGDELPLAWTKQYGEGRVYYNALGHFDGEWERAEFQAQILGGLRWAACLET